MRRATIASLVSIAASLAFGQAKIGTAQDEASIRAIVDHWRQTWDHFDACFLKDDYADDADWLNAFGVHNQGSEKILAFMAGMVKRPNVQGRNTTWGEPRIRFVRPDVALAYRDYTTIGHKMPDGKAIPQRDTHSTWLLTKDQGKWRIISQVIYDDR